MLSDARSLTLNDGTLVGYAEYGTMEGIPIIALHGMPNTHSMWKSADKAAAEGGLRLIAPDRAGYGLSRDQVPRTLLGYAALIADFADRLGLDRFVILAASGGGPYGYACAHQLSRRLLMTAIVSSMAPFTRLNVTNQMDAMNRRVFKLGRWSPALTSVLLTTLLRLSLPGMQKYVQNGTSPSADLSPELFAIVVHDLIEATRTGRRGIANDLKNYWRDWGFQLEAISSEVYLWHGEADNLAPVQGAHYMAEHLPHCHAQFYPGEGHADPLAKHIAEIVAKVVEVAGNG